MLWSHEVHLSHRDTGFSVTLLYIGIFYQLQCSYNEIMSAILLDSLSSHIRNTTLPDVVSVLGGWESMNRLKGTVSTSYLIISFELIGG
jgi:hypothetical protein